MIMYLNQKMAMYLEQQNFDDLPASVIETAKKFILDILATGIAGWEAPGCREAVQTVTEFKSRESGRDVYHPGT